MALGKDTTSSAGRREKSVNREGKATDAAEAVEIVAAVEEDGVLLSLLVS